MYRLISAERQPYSRCVYPQFKHQKSTNQKENAPHSRGQFSVKSPVNYRLIRSITSERQSVLRQQPCFPFLFCIVAQTASPCQFSRKANKTISAASLLQRMRDSIGNLPSANCIVLPPSSRRQTDVHRTSAFGWVRTPQLCNKKADTHVATTHIDIRSQAYCLRPAVNEFSHGLTNSPPDCWLHQCAHWCRPFESYLILCQQKNHPFGVAYIHDS